MEKYTQLASNEVVPGIQETLFEKAKDLRRDCAIRTVKVQLVIKIPTSEWLENLNRKRKQKTYQRLNTFEK